MTLNITIPENINDSKPKISVIGIGGAGGNAVNTMINEKIENIDFIVANTDGQALSRNLASKQIQLGKNITSGLGAGSDAETGKRAADESIEEIIAELSDVNMLFIATGMGGGTGSGAAPVIAKAAREKGILTVAVVTKPFDFEGKKRMEVAEKSLSLLKENVDTLIVIPNQNLFKIANEKTTFTEAFKMADDVLYQGICGITNLITNPGMINLDFADIRAVMGNMGKAMMGTGESSGENRAKNAAQAALNNPLLDDTSIKGAKSILLNIQGGPDMALFEVDEAASKIRNEVDENANIIFGSSIDNNLEGILKVSVVATGINTTEVFSHGENQINDEEEISEEFILSTETKSVEINPENSPIDSNINLLDEVSIDQTDLETEINKLEVNQNSTHINQDILGDETRKDELKELFEHKPENKFTESKPQTFLNRVTSLFGSKKIYEEKLEPNLNVKKEQLLDNDLNEEKLETNLNVKKDRMLDNDLNDENNSSKIFLNEEKVENDKLSNAHMEIKKDVGTIVDQTNDIDLFNNHSQSTSIDHQIDLTDIEQEDKDIDEKVLEIPAFLRRQAN